MDKVAGMPAGLTTSRTLSSRENFSSLYSVRYCSSNRNRKRSRSSRQNTPLVRSAQREKRWLISLSMAERMFSSWPLMASS